MHTLETIENLHKRIGEEVELRGWVQNKRESKGIVFLTVRDGSGFAQCIVLQDTLGNDGLFEEVSKLGLESSLILKGKVEANEKQQGGLELQVSAVEILQNAENYPIGKKEHGVDFLMSRRHLWLRSRRQWAVMRVRNKVIFTIHKFFQEQGFMQMDAPIFTGNAAEGTSTLFETDFFDRPAYLSQSGQLYGEAMAMAMGKIYTFGPTFRAEKSKTRRHLSEFWMIEPEMAFYNLAMTMDLIEEFIREIVLTVLAECKEELNILERDTTQLEKVAQPFTRLLYPDAVDILKGRTPVNGKTSLEVLDADLVQVQQKKAELEADIEARSQKIAAGGMKKGEIAFNEEKIRLAKIEIKNLEEAERNIPQWKTSALEFVDGNDLGGSDETVLTRMFETPIMVYHWPKEIKAFYMKEVEGDAKWVKGVDVLAPEGYGEIVGGGERETNIDVLVAQIEKHQLPMDVFEWYLDLRRYGSVPHSGFGLGLERMITWICKLPHLREAIPFPRYMGTLEP